MKIFTQLQRDDFKLKLQEFLTFDNTDTQRIYEYSKEFETLDELYNSEELKQIYSGYLNVMSDRMRMDRENDISGGTKFIGAYLVGTDIYKKYKADGLTFFKKITVHSCINNTPFNEVLIIPGFITVIHRRWGRCEENRVRLRGTEYTTVTTCL